MEQWLQANQQSIPNFQVGLNAISSRRSIMEWGRERAQAILRAARGSANVALPTTLLLATSVVLLWR